MTSLLTGEVMPQTHTVIQVGTCLNYLDASGAWQPSQDLIELTADGGAAAVKAPTRVYWSPAGLNQDDALTIVTPSNRVFQARVLGVYYFSPATGESKLLAAPSDQAVAELHPPNQIVYRSAFNSDLLKADLRYTYTKYGFESEVILTAQPGLSPLDCGFDPAAALLQVRHQWLAPTPRIRTVTLATAAGPELTDDILDFGDLRFPAGRAFATDGSSSTDTNVAARVTLPTPGSDASGVPVGKQWQSAGAAGTLIESVVWSSIAPLLAALPLIASADSPSPGVQPGAAPGQGLLAQTGLSAGSGIQLAGAPYGTTGLSLDYNTVPIYGPYQDYTFQAFDPINGPEYEINGNDAPADFSGTVTFQGGCVIKYVYAANLTIYGSVVCSGSQASPSILTSWFDNQYGFPYLGTPIAGDVGIGLYFDYALQGNLTLKGLVIRYANTAIECDESCTCNYGPCLGTTVENCAFYKCNTAVYTSGMNVTIQNSAVNSVTTPLAWAGGCFYNNSGSFGQGSPPAWSVNPVCQYVQQGSSATFTAALSPATAATYQWNIYTYQQVGGYWQWAWPPIPGATGPSLTLANPTNGTSVEVVGGNPFGSAVSSGQVSAVVLSNSAWTAWADFIGSTNGETPNVWTTIQQDPPALQWNVNSPIYGKTGYTAISQLNSWYVCQVPVTALTGRHGYTRGHGMISGTAITNNPMSPAMTVYFCGPFVNNLVTVNVLADITRNDGVNDYTVLLFDSDVTASGITPMQVSSEPQGQTVQLATQQAWYGRHAGTVALVNPTGPFACTPLFPLLPYYCIAGDSGSPVMVLTDDNYLVFTRGTTTSGPGLQWSSQMQWDMDTLIGIANSPPYNLNLNPANYKMQWYPR